MQERSKYRYGRPTIGVLAGWQVYEGALHSFFVPLFDGIRRAAQELECNLLFSCGVRHATPEEEAYFSIRPAWPVISPDSDFVPVGPWNTDGLLAITPLLSNARSRDIHNMMEDGHPVVFIGTGEEGPAVAADNEGGVRRAISHLAEVHGHRRIAFIAGHGDSTADSLCRFEAYLAAVDEYGLEDDDLLIAYGLNNRAGGRRAMQQILDFEVPFTAVLANNDESAFGAIDALKEAGLKVPGDVAVIGFDDRLEAAAQVPPLTTVRYLLFDAGHRALELLLKYITGEAKDPEVVKIATPLVVRRSCGCLSSSASLSVAGSFAGLARLDEKARQQLAGTMASAVASEAQELEADKIYDLCYQLADGFFSSVKERDAQSFRRALEEVLYHVEETGADVHVWQGAISVLVDALPAMFEGKRKAKQRQRAESMLHQARIAISEGAQRRYIRHLVTHGETEDQVGWVAARFLATMDEPQVLAILGESLRRVGLRRAEVAFFEPEAQDPVAWSVVRSASEPEKTVRCRSREFPPPGLYPTEEPFRLALLPLTPHEGVNGFVAFDADNMALCATVARQLSAALKSARLYHAAEEGRRLAEEASRMKSRFLSTVSHELRTPLNLVVGLSEMLLREEAEGELALSETYRQDLERIHTSAQHLDGLIRDVLDLARSDAGRLELVREPLELREVVESVAMVGEQMARDKGLTWVAEVPDTLPMVWGDKTRLRQVILNLVGNAIKFTSQGEVVLRVNGPPPHSSSGSRYITVSISDTGVGIPPDEQETIFDEFRQSERTAARGYGGLGLGLAICRRLVELHGGRIWVESSGEEGAGSTFTFTLPILESETQAAPEARDRKVLLLREHRGGSKLLREHLEREGFEVEELWTGETADWLSQVVTAPPGAVVLNVEPTSERGWEVLRMLKANPATQDVPVMLCSLAEEKNSGAVLELDYLTKPLGTAELGRALERQGLGEASGSGEQTKTILVVDDEPGILDMHARVVEAHVPRCRVLKARNGWEALEVMRQKKPDLVLLDLMMPELDGFGVLELMQERGATRDIPVIVLTAQVLTEKDMERLSRGVTAVLGKGVFSVEEALAHVEEALARKRRVGDEAQRVVRKALGYMHERYAEPISREEVADYAGVSRGYLSRCFRQETGLSLMAYLNRYRVNQARALLEAGGQSVAEVALAVGFSDASYFSRVFRREVGMSPSAYRRGYTEA